MLAMTQKGWRGSRYLRSEVVLEGFVMCMTIAYTGGQFATLAKP
jgi:ABC-type uncharacterized transport system permease subunit